MAKKDFSTKANPAVNPAMQFLSTPEPTKQTKRQADHAIGKQERKSKRLNLLLQPSILDDLTKVAYMRQTSVNDLINTTLKALVKAEASTVDKYNQIFGGEDK